MRRISIVLAGLLLATAALAQDTPPPPAPGAAPGPVGAAPPPPGDVPPPPPGGPRGDRPSPPPPGAAVMIDRGPNGAVHVDVHCARNDTTKDCVEIAARLFTTTSAKETPAK